MVSGISNTSPSRSSPKIQPTITKKTPTNKKPATRPPPSPKRRNDFDVMAEEVMQSIHEEDQHGQPTEEENATAHNEPRWTRVGFLLKAEGHGKGEGSGSYWRGDGDRQALYDQLYEDHVPDRGAPLASAPKAAMYVYALSKVLHEYYNNGFCNALDHFEPGQCVYTSDKFGWGYDEMLAFLHSRSETAGVIMDRYIDAAAEADEERERMEQECSEESDEE